MPFTILDEADRMIPGEDRPLWDMLSVAQVFSTDEPQKGMSMDFWTIFGSVVGALALVGTAYGAGRIAGYRQARGELNNEREAKRFSELYAPLMSFFTTCHIATSNGLGAPRLTQRLANAKRYFKNGQFNKSLFAIFDKLRFPTLGEIEFGAPFPLDAATKLVKERAQFADQKLLFLIAHANRAQYEQQPHEHALTAADIELFEHVGTQHGILSRRFTGIG